MMMVLVALSLAWACSALQTESISHSHSRSRTLHHCGRPATTASTNYSTCALYYKTGDKCAPKCVSGYAANTTSGSLTVTCKNGAFTKSSAVCVPKSCATPNNTITPLAITDYSVCNKTIPSGEYCLPTCHCLKPGRHIPTGYNFNITCKAGKFLKALNNCSKSCFMDVHHDYDALREGVSLTLTFMALICIGVYYHAWRLKHHQQQTSAAINA